MKQSNHIIGLDLWRSLLLLGGPVTHTALMIGNVYPEYDAIWSVIQWSIHIFRMQAFFFISGILGAFSYTRNRESWVIIRVIQLLMPLLSFWVVIMMPITILYNDISGHHISLLSPQHLWFLLTLIIITISVRYVDMMSRTIIFILDNQTIYKTVMCFSIVAVLVAVLSFKLNEYTNSKLTNYIFLNTIKYGIYYFFGFFIAKSANAFEKIRCIKLWNYAIWTGIVSSFLYYMSYINKEANHSGGPFLSILEGVSGLTATLVCFSILSAAVGIKEVPFAINMLKKCSFSIYLFHFPIIQIIFLSHIENNLSVVPLFIFVTFMALALSVIIHEVLSRYKIYKILFNGKIDKVLRNIILSNYSKYIGKKN